MSRTGPIAAVVKLVPRTARTASGVSEIGSARLVSGAIAKEPWAQAAIFDLHVRVVRGVLRRALGPGIDVEDALQETFVQFFRSVEKLENPEALRSFLIGIALRVAASERRRRRLKRWLTLTPKGEIADVVATTPDERNRAALRRFYAILDELDEESRLTFVLRHVEQLSLEEMVSVTGLSLSTIKRRLAKVEPVVMARARREPLLAGFVADGDAPALRVVAGLEEVGS